MEPKTCHHCGYEWTPRKVNPKKCPQCMNPLWKSPRPKRRVDVLNDPHYVFFPPTDASLAECAHAPDDDGPEVELAFVPRSVWPTNVRTMLDKAIEEAMPKDSLSEAKARAEELFRRLTV